MWFEHAINDLVPVFFFLMIAAIIVGPTWIKSHFAAKDRAQLHETLRVAYEKGQPVPPELIESLQSQAVERIIPTPERDLRRAIVLIAVGVGLVGVGYALWYGLSTVGSDGTDLAAAIAGGCTAAAGAVPGLIGIAYLILWFTKRNAPKA